MTTMTLQKNTLKPAVNYTKCGRLYYINSTAIMRV